MERSTYEADRYEIAAAPLTSLLSESSSVFTLRPRSSDTSNAHLFQVVSH